MTKIINFLFYSKKFSVIFVTVFVMIALSSLYFIKNLKSQYSFDQFQSPTMLKNKTQTLKGLTSVTETSPFIMTITKKSKKWNWLSPQNLKKLSHLEKKIIRLRKKQIQSTKSLASVSTAVINTEIFSTGSLLELIKYKKNTNSIKKDELLTPLFINLKQDTVSLYVWPKIQPVDSLKKLHGELTLWAQKAFPHHIVRVSGAPAFQAQITKLLSKELLLFLTLSLLTGFLVLGILFKKSSVLILSFILIFICQSLSFSLLGFFSIPFTILSNTMPILITATVISILTHTLLRMAEEKVDDGNKSYVTWKVHRQLFKSHLLTALTTSVGFGSLYFSPVPIIKDYGLSVAMGVLITGVSCLMLLPFLLQIFPFPAPRKGFYKINLRMLILPQKYPRLVVMVFILLTVATSLKGFQLNWNSSLFHHLPPHHPLQQSQDFQNKQMGGSLPLSVVVEADPKSASLLTLKNIKKMDRLIQKWKHQKGVGHVMGVSSYIKATQAQGNLPKSSQSLAEAQLLYGMSSENPLPSVIAPSGKKIRIQFQLQDLPSNQIIRLKNKIKSEILQTFPHTTVSFWGLAAHVHEDNQRLSKNLISGFYQALFWIFLLIVISFRSLKWALVSILPNLIPPATLLFFLYWTQTPIQPGIALIFSISLGLAFDNTVYLLGRLKNFPLKESCFSWTLKKWIFKEGKSCLLSSLVILSSFSIFVFSYFPINKAFGLFMILGLSGGLMADLFFLPALLKLFPSLLAEKNSKTTTASSALTPPNPITSHKRNHSTPTPTTQGVEIMKQAAVVVLSLMGLMLIQPPLAQARSNEAHQILKKVEKTLTPPYESSKIQMTIFEPDGSQKKRELTLNRSHKKEQKTLVKIQSPMDLKGVGFLSIQNSQQEDQWLFLPSARRSRRLVGSSKNSKFLDSDLTYDDFSVSTYDQFQSHLLKKLSNKKTAVIESVSKNPESSTYAKIRTWVDKKTYKILKSEHYNQEGQLIKKMNFTQYKKIGKRYYRAQKVEVKDILQKRKTVLKLTDLKTKRLPSSLFTLSQLERP